MTRRGNFKDFSGLIGRRFGRFIALALTRKYDKPAMQCRCDCGNHRTVCVTDLIRGHIVSCGCFNSDRIASVGKKHRTTHGATGTKEFRAWAGMISRCRNPNYEFFKHYGGRGIKVCERWLKPENFLADMGSAPAGTSLDRIDTNGNYEPRNCRWATRGEQMNNMRTNRLVTHGGETKTISQWAQQIGLNPATLSHRLKRGWPTAKALTRCWYGPDGKPSQKRNSKHGAAA
jgi:hypothetical protein